MTTHDTFPLMGARAQVLATGDDTADAWEALELDLGPGARSPLHTLSADKLFHVVAGRVAVTVGDEVRDVGVRDAERSGAGPSGEDAERSGAGPSGEDAERSGAGPSSTVFVPAGVPHRYENTSGERARMLVIVTGRSQVEFLRGMSRLTADGRPDPAAVAEHTRAHGVAILPA